MGKNTSGAILPRSVCECDIPINTQKLYTLKRRAVLVACFIGSILLLQSFCKMIVSEMLPEKSLQAALSVEAKACEKPLLHFTSPRWILEMKIYSWSFEM